MIKLSVIVPCYNVEDYLEKCVDSIISNNISDMEVILVNDGSKDNTLKLIKKLEKKYKCIKVVDKVNGGLSDARNAGMKVAKGKYIAFVDSDDSVNENMFVEMLKKAEEGDFDLVTCCTKMVYDDHDLNVGTGYENDLIGKDAIKNQMYDFYPAAWNKLYKKDVLKEIEFKKGYVYEDVEFIYRLLPNLNSIGYVPGYYYNYMQREGSITYTYNDKLYHMVDNFDTIIKYYKENNIFDEYREEIEYVFMRYAFATFIKRLAKCKDKKKFKLGVDYVLKKVKDNFPEYKKNKYLSYSKKGLYLKHFNKFIANVVYLVEKDKKN